MSDQHLPDAEPVHQPRYVRVPFERLAPAAETAALHQLVALAARLHDQRRR